MQLKDDMEQSVMMASTIAGQGNLAQQKQMQENLARIQLRFDSMQAQLDEKNSNIHKLTVKC